MADARETLENSMDYSQLDLFSMARTRMKYLADAQDKLAQNVVNADNPNYTPKEVKEPDFSKELKKSQSTPKTRQLGPKMFSSVAT